MFNRVMWCAAGLLMLVAASGFARAEESPISFVSGPFAGAVAEETDHQQETLTEMAGTKTSDSAVFRANGMVALVYWARLSMDYRWEEGNDIEALTRLVQRAFNASGAVTLRSDRRSVDSFDARYRIVSLTGTGDRCGVFVLRRIKNLISGFACAPSGRDVPVEAVMEGISINNVIGP
jgi:hypothetical protein